MKTRLQIPWMLCALLSLCQSRAVLAEVPAGTGEKSTVSLAGADRLRADVAEVRGVWTGDEGRVTWQLGSSWGTAGFYVYRVDLESGAETRLNDLLLPVAFYEPDAVYAQTDPEANEDGEGTYRLEEVELAGAVLDLGVHTVVFTPPPPPAPVQTARTAKAAAPMLRNAELENPATSSVLKVLLEKEGIYGVDLQAIADGMGLALEAVQTLAEAGSLRFMSQGRPVPVLYDAARGRVVFHGEPTYDWYTRDASYLITVGAGRALPRRDPEATNGTAVFPVQLCFEEDRLPLDSVTQIPVDFYYWNFIISSTNPASNQVDFAISLDGYTGGALTLSVDLQGWSQTTAHNPDHHAEFSLNGEPVGTLAFDDQDVATAVLEIPTGVASNGANTLTVRGALPAGYSYSYFVLDGIHAEYDRTLAPLAGTAYLRAGEATSVSAQAFEEPLVLALDAEGWCPTWIADENGELPDKAWAVAYENERFAVIEADAVPMLEPEPAAADAWFMSETNQIDYLVIASRALASTAQELADYRASQGLRVGVAVYEDICDLVYDGLQTPEAIPELMSYVASVWPEPPQMVVLAGNGHYDYLGTLSNEVNHLPPMLVQTSDGFFASDELLAESGGDTGPDVAIGRLPALTAEDLAAMIAKIEAFEAESGAPWQNQLAFAADRADAAGNFSGSNTRLTNLVVNPYAVALRIDLDTMAIGLARSNLMERFNVGTGFIHYTGHGTSVRLSSQGLLTTEDVHALTNARSAVVVALCCLAGHYEAPAVESLGEALMLRAQGGAVAVWASSAMARNEPSTELAEACYRDLLQAGPGRLGPSILQARQSLPGDMFTRDTFATYNLLGDPALRLVGNESTNPVPSPAQVFLQDLAQTYDGTPKNAMATTDPSGLTVEFTYDGSAAVPTEAGSYAVAATVVDSNYAGSATGTLVVAPAAAAVALGGLAQTYDGTPKSATATTDPTGLTVELTYDGTPASPTDAGSYAVVATVVDSNYAGSATGTLAVARAAAAVALGGLAQTYDGTPKSATATTAPSGLAVEFTYGGSSAVPTDAGNYAVVATVSDANYTGSATGTLGVAQAAQTIDFPALGDTVATQVVGLEASASSGLPVSFAVGSGPASIAGGTNLSFGGTGTVSIVASQSGDANRNAAPEVTRTFQVFPAPMPDAFNVNVRENGEGRFFVKLDAAPAANTTVTVARSTGDTNLTVKSGATLVFTPTNWSTRQAVTLGAAEDADAVNGMATFQIDIPGATSKTAMATELDDDIGTNLALASGGSQISGGSLAGRAIDGLHMANTNYAYMNSTNVPPGALTLDLKGTAVVSRVRVLNWDWDYRMHRYTIESSLNGTTWSNLVDASAGVHQGWEDWDVGGAIRYLRLTGLSNSVNALVCVPEWEVYGSWPVQVPVLVTSATNVNVRENGEGRFYVKLDRAPTANTTVTVARSTGDAELTVPSGAARVFTPANWSTWQGVTLAAADDADATGGTAAFSIEAPGAVSKTVTAKELDDDIGTNLALASAGSHISGGSLAGRAIDGLHMANTNYAYLNSTSVPPGALTLDLRMTTGVSRVRVLNWDWDYRVHRYTIESSPDGTTWSNLVDASSGMHRGWEDWAVNGTARYLRLTGLSNSANAFVCIAEWEVYGMPLPVTSVTNVFARENGEGRFFVKLDRAPTVTTTVTVARLSGDADLTIQSGGTLTFVPTNWSVWQAVTLAAGEDADETNGAATIRVATPGAATKTVAATELDDDLGANLALASGGSHITGGSLAGRAIDGLHTASTNYAYLNSTNVPPGAMTLDLRAAETVSRVRVLNWDWTYRVHRYTIESSPDGTNWLLLADASAEDHQGWDDWAVADESIRYLRLTGLSNSANALVCIAEWEVYGAQEDGMRAGEDPEMMMAADGLDLACAAWKPEPTVVVTSDDGPEHTNGWAAVDGDPNTLWEGEAGAGGWHIAIGYEPTLIATNLEVDVAEGSLAGIECLYSLDGVDWSPLPADLEGNPVQMNYLWVLFPSDGTPTVPQVIEIRPQP